VGLPSPSLLGNKNSLRLKALPTTLSVVLCADKLRSNSAAVHMVAGIATAAGPELVVNTSLALSTYIGWGDTWPMYVPIQF
jgi:hypothetical protein